MTPTVLITNKGFGKKVNAISLVASFSSITLASYASLINFALLGRPLNKDNIIIYEELEFILNKKEKIFLNNKLI